MKIKNKQSGFTIIEVMIATLVFSIVLLICLVGVTRIGKLYYKGVSSSQAQEFMRNLSFDLTQQIEFGGNAPEVVSNNATPAVPLIFCIGDYRYRVVVNRQLGDVPSVLKRKPYSGECIKDETVQNFDGAVELASRGMRIQRLKISSSTVPGGTALLWTIDIKVALGADDLLDFPGGTLSDDPAIYEVVPCKTALGGSEFCATSELITTVNRRIR